jgi:hypothetical protein
MKVTCFLQLEPVITTDRDGNRKLRSVKAAKITQVEPRPNQIVNGAKVVQLEIDVPPEVFLPVLLKGKLPSNLEEEFGLLISDLEDDIELD